MWREGFRKNPKLAAALIPLIAGVVFLQSRIDPLRRQPAIEPGSVGKVTSAVGGAGLPFEYSLAAVSGFRQVIAGLLWVRADTFFHSGNYEAILPMLRLITWLDPNWIDVYATGAWHLMYNFTDNDQRSDRRYLPNGIALLNEGIANNPKIYDVYKEKGWNNFDKIKDFDEAIKAYEGARKNDTSSDVNQVWHPLGHSYERSGQIDAAIDLWEQAAKRHQELLSVPNAPDEVKYRNKSGYENAVKNASMLRIRKEVRAKNIAALGQIDTNLKITVKRLRPRVLDIRGTANLEGTLKDAFDAGVFDPKDPNKIQTIGKGILRAGPVDGSRFEVRLQDEGYAMPAPDSIGTFTFEVDPNLTIMQDALSTRGGRKVLAGEAFLAGSATANDPAAEAANAYMLLLEDAKKANGVPIAQALSSGTPISANGQRQLVALAYGPRPGFKRTESTPAEIAAGLARLKADKTAIAALTKKAVFVARAAVTVPGKFGREFDLTKDPKMYSFAAKSYDLIITFNPRNAPDNVQDRIGYSGEGITDKKYLATLPEKRNLRVLRFKIRLTQEDILGEGEKVLYQD